MTQPTAAEINRGLFGRRRSRRNPETDIVNSCLEFLNLLPGVTCWRQNVGAMEVMNEEGEKRVVRFGAAGMADISGIWNGRRVEIEVKCPGKTPRPDQTEWLEMIRKSGGVAFWCDSIDSCMAQAKAEGMCR